MSFAARVRKRLLRGRAMAQAAAMEHAPAELEVRKRLQMCDRVIDLGCGENPVAGATVAVDLFVDARQRGAGARSSIDQNALDARSIRFVRQSIDEPLPFPDASFQFAYCSHAIEHVRHPGRACDEMMRVAAAGLLRCPYALAEFLHGREYHRWIVFQRGGTVLFLEKRPDEYGLFGSATDHHPGRINPFEALLDWHGQGPRTPGGRVIGRLKHTLQRRFYGRTPLSEVNLFWHGGFRWIEVHNDGRLVQGGHPGSQYGFLEDGSRWETP